MHIGILLGILSLRRLNLPPTAASPQIEEKQ